ncbi:reverse transcriptase domain-containing protein [Tanacetum coccineum]
MVLQTMILILTSEGAAQTCLEKEPPNSITNWDDLVSKFVNQFFPPSRTTNLRNDITNFQQKYSETFSEAWERFKDLLTKSHHHGFSPLHQIDTFYNGLDQSDQNSLNSMAGGNLLKRNTQEALTIIENKSKVRTSRNKPQVSSSIGSSSQNDTITTLTKQVEAPAPTSKSNEIPKRNAHQPPIPYPSRLNKDKLQDKFDIQITKFLKIFKKLHFNIILLNKLPKKLGDLGKFLIPCYFKELEVDKFTFPADFVVVDYDVDPCVPLILERPLLRINRTLVDVYGEELTLRVREEKLIFNVESTLKYPQKHGDESINQIDIIDTTYEDHFHEVLNVQKLIHPLSSSPTPSSDSIIMSTFPSLTPLGNSDFLLEETDAFLALDSIPPGIDNEIFDAEGDILLLEKLLNIDSTKDLPP